MQKKAKMSLEKRHNLTGWAFLIPAALLIFIFCFYQMVQERVGAPLPDWQITREF